MGVWLQRHGGQA
uniref:Uncharacterized protein n=1 Tax=Arundo donax TaxID=35708 RepID=A0A0A9EAK5_ARUDO